MGQLLDNVRYLSQQIGPRPAGTEEEQQAALYIAERIQSESGLSAVIDDLSISLEPSVVRGACAAAVAVCAVMGAFVPLARIALLVVALAATAVYALEALGHPVVSRALGKGVSQNVVARYVPSAESGGPARTRKVVLVASYDSGRVKPFYVTALEGLPIPVPLGQICLGCLVAIDVLLLMNQLFAPDGSIVLQVLLCLLALVSLVPALRAVALRTAPFSEGANDNAAGVAVLIDVARRVGMGGQSADTVVHGAEAARASGVAPEGAELVYEVPPSAADADRFVEGAQDGPASTVPAPVAAPAAAALEGEAATPPSQAMAPASTGDAGLDAAKAALAAFTSGSSRVFPLADASKPAVSTSATAQPSASEAAAPSAESEGASASVGNADQEAAVPAASAEGDSVEGADADLQAASQADDPVVQAAPASPAAAAVASYAADPNLPAWFVNAQQKARRADAPAPAPARSRYADAGEEALAQRAAEAAVADQAAVGAAERPAGAESAAGAWDVITVEEAAANQLAGSQAPVRSAEQAGSASEVSAREDSPAAFDTQAASDQSAEGALPDVADAAQDAPPTPAAPRSQRSEGDAVPAGFAGGSSEVAVEQLSIPPVADTLEGAFDQPAPSPAFMKAWSEEAVAQTGRIELPSLQDDALAAQRPLDGASSEASARGGSDPAVPAAKQQPAPLASHPAAPHDGRLRRIPGAEALRVGTPEASRSGMIRGMRTLLPSVSGTITRMSSVQDEASAADARFEAFAPAAPAVSAASAGPEAAPSFAGEAAQAPEPAGFAAAPAPSQTGSISTVGSFVAGGTGQIAPVGDELLAGTEPDDRYVDDADDSHVDDSYTESGALAGPGYVDMPKSRMRRFLDRFGRGKKQDISETPQEWLDVDRDFDARERGRARGGWESFRNDSADFVPVRHPQARPAAPAQDQAYTEDGYLMADDSALDPGRPLPRRSGGSSAPRGWEGGAFTRVQLGRVDTRSGEEGDRPEPVSAEATSPMPEVAAEINEEISQIYHFNNPDFTTEVWFVALGSQVARREGMRAFLDKHAADLRGAVVIELTGLGAGTLSAIKREGTVRPVSLASHIKRHLAKAARITGRKAESVELLHTESATTEAARRGIMGVHLAGIEHGAVALSASQTDVVENIDEALLSQNADFVTELVKSV
ncbi:hypothetical protein HLV35_00635 [Eggerthellaceae bacterium zg-997]|nr:hypothetical protein [Eggerthellaceae bacterium zg-997]